MTVLLPLLNWHLALLLPLVTSSVAVTLSFTNKPRAPDFAAA
jgi:hypothetical protein